MEAINELLDKIKMLIQKNQNDINSNSELIESTGNSIEDKRLITDTLSNIRNVTLLEERIDVISKYATDDEARTIRYFIATYNNFDSLFPKLISPNFILVISTGTPSFSGGEIITVLIFFPLQSNKFGKELNIKIFFLSNPIAA